MTAGTLAEVVRGDLVESVHRGHLVVLAPDGRVVVEVGDPDAVIWPRSSLKPLQAVAMLAAGLDVDDEGLALACASHSGTDVHLAVVRRVLDAAGLAEADLRNTPDLPLDADAAFAWRAAGRGPTSLTQNCSGKHAAMLATCVAAGWDVRSYLDPGHPLQQAVRATVEGLTGVPVASTSVDGCGAPLLSTTVRGLARALGRIAAAASTDAPADAAATDDAATTAATTAARTGTAADGPRAPLARVARAMSSRPDLVGGPGRDVTAVMRAVPGLVAKDGAEGVYAAGLPDGSGVAFKVEDGSGRPRPAVLVAALAQALAAAGH
ncbi:asparaginase, partial [Actinotalea ferrariae]|uniref:asparaginase n=1 Tax=Actinotalea ferrariae TaxID=1386098 RepID=UPI0027E052E6